MSSRILMTLAVFFATVLGVNAQQEFYMGNGLVTTCDGTFRDSGPVVTTPNNVTHSNYDINENFVQTICPDSGNFLVLDFSSMNIGAGDVLTVYDGPSTSFPLIQTFTTGTTFTGLIFSDHPSNTQGCLTFVWTSDGDTNTVDEGWVADISCTPPCQNMFVDLLFVDPDTTGPNAEIDACFNATGTWTVTGDYPMNGIWYNQNNGNVQFDWSLENVDGDTFSFGTGQNITTTFDTIGALFMNIKMTDINGCNETEPFVQVVRVAGRPDFTGTDASTDSACYGIPFDLTGNVSPYSTSTYITPVSGDSLSLPDNVNQPFTSILPISGFPQNQTINSVADIQDVWMDIEHCYIGDLAIDLTCPSGATVLLKSFPGGGGDWLGIPCDNGAVLPIGQTFPYQWKPAGNTFGTMNAVANAFPCTGCLNTVAACNGANGNSLDSSSYDPITLFTNFIGCPINGNWTLTIVDNLAIDNGYIDSWGINFAQNILPLDSIDYTVGIDSVYWTVDPLHSTETYNTANTAGAAGNIFDTLLDYQFNVIDSFGCSHVDTVQVFIKSPCDPSCAANIVPAMGQFPAACVGDSTGKAWAIPVDSISPGPYDFYWRNNSGDTIAIHYNIPGTDTMFNLGANPYSVVVVDSFGCETVGNITVNNVPPIVSAIVNPSQTSCAGVSCDASATATVLTGGTAPFIYSWDNGGYQQIDTNLCVGLRAVQITDSRGCIDSATITITEPDSIKVQAFGEDTICISNVHLLSAVATGGSGGYIYKWNKNLADGSPTQASPTITQTYIVSATDVNNCPIDTASVTVYVREPLEAELLPIDTICNGDAITLVVEPNGGDGNYGYTWSDGISFIDSMTFSPTSSQMVYVTVSDVCGTSPTATDSIWVQVGGYAPIQPVMELADTICAGEPYILRANAIGGLRPYVFEWNNGLGLGQVQAIAPDRSTTYTVTISDRCESPIGIQSIRIYVDNFKDFVLESDAPAKCFPEEFTFNINPYIDTYTYAWDFGGGMTPTGNSQFVSSSFMNTGCQDVGVRVTTDNGCVSTRYFDCAVTVYPKPDADYVYDPINPDVINSQVTFTSIATGNTNQYWYVDDELIGDREIMVHTFQDSGDYRVKLVAENTYCADSVNKVINIDYRTALWVPTAFTPNGDTKNDVFLPQGDGVRQFEMDIYDRWGKLVFKTRSIERGWDGTYENGDDAGVGIYVYHIKYTLHNGSTKTIQGEIHLIK